MKRKVEKNLFVLLFILVTCAVFSMEAHAAEFTTTDFVTLSSMDQYDTANSVDSRVVTSTGKSDIQTYSLELNLKQDSWVYFTGNYSLSTHDGAGTDVHIYSNNSMSNKKGEFGFGYWRYHNTYTDFFSAGTYYVSVSTNKENYQTNFSGNVNIMAVAIPVSEIFSTTADINSNKSSATISFTNALGQYLDYAEYQKGAVSLSNVYSNTYWYNRGYASWSGNENAKVITPSDDVYSFNANTNSKYTIMVQTTDDKRYSKIITVSGLDKTKPTVKGVKNKKTYTKSVKVTFSDKGTGIKKATLNGKKIKAGKKVTKKGSYTLKVYDKAGNVKKVTFKIK